jgi:hypothetical protein
LHFNKHRVFLFTRNSSQVQTGGPAAYKFRAVVVGIKSYFIISLIVQGLCSGENMLRLENRKTNYYFGYNYGLIYRGNENSQRERLFIYFAS